MQLDSQYLHCIQKAPTQGVGRTKPHPERFGRLVEGISHLLNSSKSEILNAMQTHILDQDTLFATFEKK